MLQFSILLHLQNLYSGSLLFPTSNGINDVILKQVLQTLLNVTNGDTRKLKNALNGSIETGTLDSNSEYSSEYTEETYFDSQDDGGVAVKVEEQNHPVLVVCLQILL